VPTFSLCKPDFCEGKWIVMIRVMVLYLTKSSPRDHLIEGFSSYSMALHVLLISTIISMKTLNYERLLFPLFICDV
jgi:hypothetical protein